jgi:C4-dicarboxylate transporter DctM subunit
VTLILVAISVLALLALPLYVLFGGAALALFLSLPEGSWASPAIDVFSANFAESPSLMTIPLFTFAGFLLAESKAPLRLIDVSRAFLGWMPGGLAIVCLMASTFFATFTGGSGVTIVAVGGLLLPALLRERYPEKFSIGLITTSAALGGMFPPSVLLIIYGIVAGLVIDKVLLAGIFPGLITTFALMIYLAWIGWKEKIPRQAFDLKEAGRSLWVFKWEAAIPIVLISGFVLGVLRFHEASAFTAVYVLFIEVFVYRDISIKKDLPRIIIESMTLIGAVFIILVMAVSFTGWMVQGQIPDLLFDFMDDHIKSKVTFLIALNVFLFIVGMFTDGVTAIIVVVPLILVPAYKYGVDPYHLATIFLLNLEIGFLVPPVGMNLFISSIRFSKPVAYVCASVVPFLVILTAALMLITYVPWFSTYLPSKLNIKEDGISLGGGRVQFDDDGNELPGDGELEAMGEDLGAIDLGDLDEPDAGPDGGTDGGAAKDAPAGAQPEGAAGTGERTKVEAPKLKKADAPTKAGASKKAAPP